jgi:hypothetical protein
MALMNTIGFCSPSTVPVDVSDPLSLATCPLCHTTDAYMTITALNAGADWRCRVCHQNWSARRLATVAAYTAWSRERDRASIV